MELANLKGEAAQEFSDAQPTPSSLIELLDLELSLIGGGMGDCIN